ncbi:HlyD family efflux transporter periplasmic adaptor subunit [Chitinophaga solisilvae]|uniref:HlyD family efflux transporter periplasmic adaptor subunit n=1 Tax=Chitinophaga solisilvae TaxID=1233460 RepID=UPI00136BC287|nr:HlyD family efflux transporter periplasmic adaptor subunit [Chitinophaga solisilvae]
MPENIDLTTVHSEELQEIIGRPPRWVIRRGSAVVAGVVVLLLLGASLIKYPAIVTAPVTLTSSPPPVKLVAATAGHITALYIEDNEQVQEEQVIAVIDNPAVTRDMFYLKTICAQLDTAMDPAHSISRLTLRKDIQAASLQADYLALLQAIAGQPGNHAAIRSMASRITAQLSIWESRYVLRSPVKGIASFFRIREKNQYVTAGETVCVITPSSPLAYNVYLQLPRYKAGKVKAGQTALIRLQEFPEGEFGRLKATIGSLSHVPLDSSYTVVLTLKDGLRTTKQQEIPRRPEIAGTADIIIEQKSILRRIFENITGK